MFHNKIEYESYIATSKVLCILFVLKLPFVYFKVYNKAYLTTCYIYLDSWQTPVFFAKEKCVDGFQAKYDLFL